MILDKALPLYLDDNHPMIALTLKQRHSLLEYRHKIDSQEYRLIPNLCLCGNRNEQKDIVLSEKDRYGLSMTFKICTDCGLIRTDPILDEQSLLDFYQYLYTNIYRNIGYEEFFKKQYTRGQKFYKLLKQLDIVDKVNTIVEVGCGMGGILQVFRETKIETIGYDYGIEYLKYGREKGLNLVYGGFNEVQNNKYDLIILSHILEHASDPLKMIQDSVLKIKKGQYILIEIPSILNQETQKVFHHYFQQAHTFHFYKDYLIDLFDTLKLKIIYCNEESVFILQKQSQSMDNKISAIKRDITTNEIEILIKKLQFAKKLSHELYLKRCLVHEN